MKNKILLIVLGCLFSTWAYAQAIKVSGRLVDEYCQAEEAAVVILIRRSDNKMLEYNTTDQQGKFALQHAKKVMAQLVIKHLSYGTKTIALPEQCDTVLNLTLSSAPYEMEEIAVKGKRVPIQFRNGDLVINVENYLDKGTERTTDVLKKLPGVFVNEGTKQVTVNGKSVELHMDGRKQNVTYDLLKALPATLLDQIVLTPNKRAEHDGDVDAAIIDIKTKKKYIDGYVGTLEGDYGAYRGIGWPGEWEGTLFTMLMKKDFYVNLTFSSEKNTNEENIYDSTFYKTSDSYLTNEQKISSQPWGGIFNANLSWNVYQGHRISANIYGFGRTKDGLSLTHGTDQQGSVKQYHVKMEGNRWNVSGNAEYESSDSLPFKLKVSYGYVGAGDKNENANDYLYPDNSRVTYDYLGHQRGRQHILKADFSKHFFDKKVSLEAGVKANFGKTKDKFMYTPLVNSLTNEYFHYLEGVLSLYVSGGWQASDKVYLSAGIRAEHTNYDLTLETITSQEGNKYWNWLPFASAFFNLHKHYNTSLSLSSGIGRPSYNTLTPGEQWYSDRYYSKGNPFLQPAKSYSLTWGNQFFQKLNLSFGGHYTKDLYNQVLLDKGDEVTESTYMNSSDSWSVSANLSLMFHFMEGRIYGNLQGNGSYGRYRNMKYDFNIADGRNRTQNASFSFYGEYWFSNEYRLKVYTLVSCSLGSKSFQDDTKSSVGVRLGVMYKCMKNTPLYIHAFATDAFNSERTHTTSYYDDNIRYYRGKEKFQGYFIGLSFSFQGGKDLKQERKQRDANAEDKRFEEK